PSLADTSPTKQAQVYSSTGYTLLYESRLTPKKPVLSAALNLFTGTLLLLLIMAGVLWLIARTMTWRIDQLSQQMTQLGDGDFTVRVNARGNDEIAALARGFNQAAQKIEHLIDANNLLLAHASHELRTPITRIRLQIEMMDMLAGALPTDTKAKFDKRAQAINRDLSGLNDLVESILLVSRLDAGHALQQVENLDLYDLVNQERQHYPEATLIGEHIVIDGQSSMLTHLIRNLLTNAMLHGKPPVTVLLYGVQSIEEAGTVPDYLLQTVLCSSFVDYNSLDFDDYEENADAKEIEHHTAKHEATSSVDKNKSDTTDSIAELPTPIIYKNGEDIAARNENNESNDDASVDNDLSDASLIDSASKPQPTTGESSLLADYYSFTSELTDRIKKVIWKAVPDSTEPTNDTDTTNNAGLVEVASTNSISNVESENTDTLIENSAQKSDKSITDTATKNNGPNNTKDDAKSNSLSNENSGAVVRKEGLFAKHMKKAKTEPERPLPKYAVLAVIDEGTGIPEGKREEVFSPFVRLQQKNKGSGLGLSLVSQIVTAHQGRIITDTLNGHTRFLVTIPIHHDPHYNYHE
ncbi:ATP-binding protein, partial [Marinobacter sp. 1Y8]